MLRVLGGALGLVACMAAVAAEIDKPTLAWTQAVVDRWEIACRKYLNVPPHPLPWIIFFDDRSAWHLNPDKSELPGHTQLRAAVNFAGRDHEVVQVEHREGRLWVPGRDALPVKAGGATMPYSDDRKVFFELALPSLWQKESGSAPSRDLDELVLGLALHELTHTRQMVDVSRRIEAMRSRHKLPESVNDNLIETRSAKFRTTKRYGTKSGLTFPEPCSLTMQTACGTQSPRSWQPVSVEIVPGWQARFLAPAFPSPFAVLREAASAAR